MSELPAGWTRAHLGELSHIVRGITFPASAKEMTKTANNVCCLRTSNIQKELRWDDVYFVSRSFVKRDDQFVRRGDILMSMANSYELVGKVAVAESIPYETAFGAFLSAVRPGEVLHGQYLFHFLRTAAVQRQIREGSSQTTNIANISSGKLNAIDTPVAPLPEQKRIADKLDALLARVDACRECLDRVPGILKRFRQSVLAAATSGELTREWREERGGTADTESWVSAKLVDLCVASRVITYGVIKLGDETPHGVPCLRTSNVRWLRIDTEGMKRIAPVLSAEFGRTVLQGGEVLVNVRGTLGGVAVVESTMRGWNVSREVAVVPVDHTRVNSRFLAFWIGSDDRQRWLSKVEKGVAYTGINIEDLRTLPVSVPPIEEQIEIVRRVQVLLESADELERRHAAIVRATEPLTPSLLAKAFRGELVPQDSNDEPASDLLAKLKTEQSNATAEPLRRRPKTRGKRPTMSNTDKDAIKAAILKLKTDRFSFDELRAQVSGDYESLKAALFELLEEPSPVVRQVFDKKAKAMQLVRVRP